MKFYEEKCPDYHKMLTSHLINDRTGLGQMLKSMRNQLHTELVNHIDSNYPRMKSKEILLDYHLKNNVIKKSNLERKKEDRIPLFSKSLIKKEIQVFLKSENHVKLMKQDFKAKTGYENSKTDLRLLLEDFHRVKLKFINYIDSFDAPNVQSITSEIYADKYKSIM